MGSCSSKFKYKHECIKCKAIEIEMQDIFDIFDMNMNKLKLIELIDNRQLRKEYIMNDIYNRKVYLNELYKSESDIKIKQLNICHKKNNFNK